jgi:hypothetical protein
MNYRIPLIAAALSLGVIHAGSPVANAQTPTPGASATPWPAPSGLRTTNAYEGSPLTTIVECSWDVLPAFTGTFEIQRADTRTEK